MLLTLKILKFWKSKMINKNTWNKYFLPRILVCNIFCIFLRILMINRSWSAHYLHSIARDWIINKYIWISTEISEPNTSTAGLFIPLVWKNEILLKACHFFYPIQVFQVFKHDAQLGKLYFSHSLKSGVGSSPSEYEC